MKIDPTLTQHDELQPATDAAASPYNVPALRKAIRLLSILSQAKGPMGVSEISRAIGLNKHMTYRLLVTLCDEGWILASGSEPKYRVSLRPLHLFSAVADQMDLREVGYEPLRRLWDELGESVYIGILDQDAVLFIDHVTSRNMIRISGTIGGRYPLHCASTGKVLLAYASETLFAQLSEKGFHRYTERTITDAVTLREHLQGIREQGWALDDEEHGRGILCFGAPIRDAAGTVVGAVGVSVTTINYTSDEVVQRLGPSVIITANEISRQLGRGEELEVRS